MCKFPLHHECNMARTTKTGALGTMTNITRKEPRRRQGFVRPPQVRQLGGRGSLLGRENRRDVGHRVVHNRTRGGDLGAHDRAVESEWRLVARADSGAPLVATRETDADLVESDRRELGYLGLTDRFAVHEERGRAAGALVLVETEFD